MAIWNFPENSSLLVALLVIIVEMLIMVVVLIMVVEMIVVLVMMLTLALFACTKFFVVHSSVAFDIYQVQFSSS